ncbi:Rieske (2Fe-2S) protein [Actinoplanes friuliensis]|jgi:nitrite reductase (NADH) small subunit|uniref:Putative nitrite reductase small subunit n=1 Tax=Actinoplanes friuliensis DSM 7358 TaxID=1246995 RepID=U5VYP5_9ACTN|nr:Rieske (2Fe-2S) protein [Actinoplanes friuliensis]AGZ42014.1 putative nitrite reductase small subunit [Actinoplanes friuliensis DSM 7358]
MTRLGPVDDIPLGEGRTYAVDGEMVAVFRLRDGSLRALQAVCPHRGGPLADGQIDLKVVVCPLHLNAFDLTTGCSLSGQPDLTVYAVTVDATDHLVISSLASAEVPS